MNHLPNTDRPALLRRLAAIAYDWLLLLALFLLLGFVYVPLVGGITQSLIARLGFQLLLLAVIWLFSAGSGPTAVRPWACERGGCGW